MKLVVSSLLVAFASSALVAAAPAQADPSPAKIEAVSPERLDLARKFVALTDPTYDFVELFRMGFRRGVSASIEDEAQLTEASVVADAYLARLEPKLREHSRPLIEAYALAYAREFSVDELQQMNAFAATPAGRHYMQGATKIVTDDLIVDATEQMMESVTPVLEEIQKEMCAAKAAKRVAMGDKKAKCPLSAAAETQAG